MYLSSSTGDPNLHRMMIITGDENVLHQIQTNYNSSAVQTVILNPKNTKNASLTNDKPSKKRPLICVVCDSIAYGRNFGVVACESCKLFFRRNGLKDLTKLICEGNNQCEVKVGKSRRCLSCRLKKCFDSGMKRDRLLRAKEKKTKRKESKTKESGKVLSDDSRLPIIQTLNFAEHTMYRNLLTVDDLQRISIIRLAYDNRIELAAQNGFFNDTTMIAQNLSEQLNSHAVPAFRLLAFFKQIPEFNQLNINDKMILIKYNLMHVITLNNVASFTHVANKLFQIDDNLPWNGALLESIHGQSVISDLQKIFRPLVQIAKADAKLFPIVFIVFILHKGLSGGEGIPEPILDDVMSVYHAQNVFTELLWKYLETAYGFYTAVRMMSCIVTKFLCWQIYYLKMRSNVDRIMSNAEEEKVSPLMKSIFHV